MALTRLFVAVSLDYEVRHALATRLDAVEIPGRRVAPESWHVTLRFIGPLEDVGRDLVIDALERSDLGTPFVLRWAGIGAFPRPGRATVVWLGVSAGAAELEVLAAAVEDAVVSAGCGEEERPFRPHLTLSRVRPPRDVTDLVGGVEPMNLRMVVDSVTLMQSRLGRGGAQYDRVESFPLG